MKWIFLALIPLVGLCPPVRADEVDCGPTPIVPVSLVQELLIWVGKNSPYEVTKSREDPPTISFCKTGEIIEYEGEDILVNADLRAAYDLPRRHIFLVQPWSAEDRFDQSRLLHELIHDVQLLNRSWECVQKPEWEAYKLQEKWLLGHGVDPQFNWLLIYFMAKCPRDIHP